MDELQKGKTKAKRKLTALDFTGKNAAVALVSKEQGGAANGMATLLVKAANFSDEFLEKSSQVKVTMEITEFLTRMFGLWYEDAEVLARALGYTTARMDDEAEDASEGETETYTDYITSKVQSIEVMKSLYEGESIAGILSELSEDEYLSLLKDQEIIEKAFADIEKQSKEKKVTKKVKLVTPKESTDVAKATEVGNSTNASVEKDEVSASVVNKSKKGNKSMTKEVQVIEQEVEVIAKSQFDEIQKAFDTQTAELTKALDLVKQFEVEKKEAIAKSRKESLVAVVGDKAEVIFKACGEATDEVFADVVKALADMQAVIEKSDLFKEQGASVEGEQIQESGVAALIKSKYNK